MRQNVEQLMFDFVWESTSSNENSQKLGKNPSAPSRNQTCELMIACLNALLVRYRKCINGNCH